MTETTEKVRQAMAQGQMVLKAVENGRIIGGVRGQIEGDAACIGRLYVVPQAQGRCVGRRLMAEAEEKLRACSVYTLFTGERSEKNLTLYARQGYALTGKTAPALPLGTDGNYDLVWMDKPNPWPDIEQCIGRYLP